MPDASARAELAVAALTELRQRYEHEGDPAILYEPDVHDDLAVLTQAHPIVFETPLEAALAGGWICWHRCLHEATELDQERTLGWFDAALRHRPDLVPDGLRLPFTSGEGDDAALWTDEAVMLLQRAFGPRRLPGISRAVDLLRRALACPPADHEARMGNLSNLGVALRHRHALYGVACDIDESIECASAAVALGVGDSDRGKCESMLAVALVARYQQSGNASDLDSAVAAAGEAVRMLGPAHPQFRRGLDNHFLALRIRARERRSPADLEAAMTLGRRIIALTAADAHPNPEVLNQLLWLYHLHFRVVAPEPADVEAAITLSQSYLDMLEPGGPAAVRAMSHLGMMHRHRHQLTGSLGDLEREIALNREALKLCTDGDLLPHLWNNLGIAVRMRGRYYAALSDLDEAVAVTSMAVEATSEYDQELPGRLSNLAIALRWRFHRGGRPADLDRSIEVSQRAVAATSDTDPERAGRYCTLANAYRARFAATRAKADLELALTADRTGVQLAVEARDRAVSVNNLARSLHQLFALTRAVSSLDEALELARKALKLSPPGDPERINSLVILSGCLRDRHLIEPDPQAYSELLELLRQGVADQSAPLLQRCQLAQEWGATCAEFGDWPSALEGYRLAVELLPMLARQPIYRGDSEYGLGELTTLACDAAAAALAGGGPDAARTALALLEQGRSVLWSQMLEQDVELDRLAATDLELAEQVRSVRYALSHTGGPSYARQWSALLEQVQAIVGFKGFGEPVSASDVLEQVTEETIVIVNVSRWRCDALLIRGGTVSTVDLSPLTIQEIADRGDALFDALWDVESPGERSYFELAQVYQSELDNILAWLWEEIADRVLTELGHTSRPADGQWPRVWWCPTGPLSFLPLHAAGHYRCPGDDRSVLCRVVPSYTPTVRALVEARDRPPSVLPGQMLLVSVPEAAGESSLGGARSENEALRRLLPGSTMLDGLEATVEDVVKALRRHRWAHFGCHGRQSRSRPSLGGLVLHDELLTISRIARERYQGEFAFLAACDTAAGGIALMDESVTLAAALHFTGVRQVIGALWSVPDRAAQRLVEDFYTSFGSGIDPAGSATALHAAQLRAMARGRPATWVQFAHTGP